MSIMILSVSRRTDIPNYFSDWFFNRLKAGFCYVRNPMNPHQVSEIALTPDVVDCIVFWTKNPGPMLDRLDELKDYDYYFQFTLTGYGQDVERSVPHKREKMIPVFRELSRRIGKERVIWRYDPIVFTEKYSPKYHVQAFSEIAKALSGYTDKCVISFVDSYAKNRKALEAMKSFMLRGEALTDFAGELTAAARKNDIEIDSCAEKIDFGALSIQHNCCIDRGLIEKLTGSRLRVDKDKNQRPECGCIESMDIGAYNTCPNGCVYCYAGKNIGEGGSIKQYDALSPLLCSKLMPQDKVTKRKVVSLKDNQLSMDDYFDKV